MNVGFLFSLFVSIVSPIGILGFLLIRKKEFLKPFLIGCLVFTVSQLIIRLPLLKFITTEIDSISIFTSLYPLVYGIILALTAGIFEEVGRYIGFKFALKDNRSWKDGIVFGLGHGSIEAFVLIGMPIIQMLITKECTISFLAGIERIIAITFHVALSLIVLYGVREKKKIYILLAILLHTLMNAGIIMAPMLGADIYLIELWFIVVIIFVWTYVIKLIRISNKKEC